MKILLVKLAVIACAAASAVGCAKTNLRQKIDDLTRDRDDLQRQNLLLDGQLASSEARVTALEKELAERRAAKPENDMDLPGGLKDKGIGISRRGSETVLDLPSDVFFPSGSAALSKEGERTLEDVVRFVKKNGEGAMVRVEGHADSDPIRRTKSKYHCNWELSFARAHAVIHLMVERGMDPKLLACDCYGEYQPVDPKNKAKNRRVEIVIAR